MAEIGNLERAKIASPPNEKALAILKTIEERQKDRPYSDSGKSQAYLREARSGEMYDDGGRDK
jgi:hypothetical protein